MDIADIKKLKKEPFGQVKKKIKAMGSFAFSTQHLTEGQPPAPSEQQPPPSSWWKFW